MSPYRPKKRLGQNFLKSPEVINRIIELVNPNENSTIVEIGPGRGVLTLPLAKSGAEVIAVEFDRDLIGYLTALLVDHSRAKILKEDFLKVTPTLLGTEQFSLVGNLPYNISSPVVDWCLRFHKSLVQAVFMVQEETAHRLAANPGSRDWSPMSILTQWRFNVVLCFTVPPSSFQPEPEVNSAVIRLVPKSGVLQLPHQFEKVVRSSFRQRRKLLVNNLVPDIVPDTETARELISDLKWPADTRAESLSIDQFLKLTELLTTRKLI